MSQTPEKPPVSPESLNNVNIIDIHVLVKAVELASTKGAFNELEVAGIQPSFEKVVSFLNAYNEKIKAQSVNQAEETPSPPTKAKTKSKK